MATIFCPFIKIRDDLRQQRYSETKPSKLIYDIGFCVDVLKLDMY
jgi:hypothetical protein